MPRSQTPTTQKLKISLDEVTQICPVPLPFWLSDSGGKGIQVIALVHGEGRAGRRNWRAKQPPGVLDSSSVKVFLPASPMSPPCKPPAPCAGAGVLEDPRQEHATRHDVATPDMIRQLPAGFALVIRGGCAPVIARLPAPGRTPPTAAPATTTPPRRSPSGRGRRPRPRSLPVVPYLHAPAGLVPGHGTGFPWN